LSDPSYLKWHSIIVAETPINNNNKENNNNEKKKKQRQ
jgi:hypothetical protein